MRLYCLSVPRLHWEFVLT